MEKLKILELFGGIGAFSKALSRLEIPYEVVDYVEIDKYAVNSYNAMHGTSFPPQDISEWDKDVQVDFIMHGSPCQDFSVAGKQAGAEKDSGTRSSLLWETLRIVKKVKPTYVMWENVKNVLSKTHKHIFDAYLAELEELGYVNYYKVLNAKDYDIPQNRERVFVLSILKGVGEFEFPEPNKLTFRLKDMLETETLDVQIMGKHKVITRDSNGFTQRIVGCNQVKEVETTEDNLKCTKIGGLYDSPTVTHQAGSMWDSDGLSPTIDTAQGGNRQPFIVETGCQPSSVSQVESKYYLSDALLSFFIKNSEVQKLKGNGFRFTPTDGSGTAVSVTTKAGCRMDDNFIKENNLRIRKLTPKECWRLMGFDDSDFVEAQKVNSNTQLYKQAGNSIVVNVLEAILSQLLIKKEREEQ